MNRDGVLAVVMVLILAYCVLGAPPPVVYPSAVAPPVGKAAAPAWITDYGAGVAEAERTGKPVALLYTASEGCAECRKLDKVLASPAFARDAAGFVRIKVDTATPGGRAVFDAAGLGAVPYLGLYPQAGQIDGGSYFDRVFTAAEFRDAARRVREPSVRPAVGSDPFENWREGKWVGAAPGVAAGPVFHAGHSCPSCGRTQYVVSGWNRDGSHSHACPACGTVWRH